MSQRQGGFTLVEVLIGTTIFAMMLALLTSALFAMTRSARAGDARLTGIDDTRLVQAFLRRQLSEAVALTERMDEKQHAFFEGQSDRLRFVGHLPAHRGGGGLQFLELRTEAMPAGERDRDALDLVLYHRNAWPDVPFDARIDAADWAKQLLVERVERVHYRYFGNQDDEAPREWHDTWSNADQLPILIKLEIETSDARDWPSIVAAVRSRTAVAQTRLFRLREEATR